MLDIIATLEATGHSFQRSDKTAIQKEKLTNTLMKLKYM